LKNKFGSGYLLEVKLKAGIVNESAESVDQRMNTLEEYVLSMFPHAMVVESFGLRAQYKVPKADVQSLAQVFSSLEEGKTKTESSTGVCCPRLHKDLGKLDNHLFISVSFSLKSKLAYKFSGTLMQILHRA
jgi:hypothetical protein